ncbi:MAG: prepilin-type N-terminal cleavage/methylation domain-containing protein, partial [Alphaproteobacteria bacterium]|nr:prepilin-type N-terminal cleavage/methylation domain-containing protein [Alphaproteobacteria bacterium]
MSLMKFKAMSTDKSNKSQRGFTLVELAIVLVIIGLIIAAVLKGQELIVSARLKTTISDIDAIRGASNTFRDKYNALPGDYANAPTRVGTPAGVTFANCDGSPGKCDGSGIIDGDGLTNETLLFWAHMAAANLISGVSPLGAATIGDGLPSAPIGGGLTIRNEVVINKAAHWIALGSGAASPTGVVDSEQALILDEKADDARPGTGSIRTVTSACTSETVDADIDGASSYDPNPATAGCVTK